MSSKPNILMRDQQMDKRHILVLAALAGVAFVMGCTEPVRRVAADTIYTGGDIITVNDSLPAVEAVAVKDGRIFAVGTRNEIERACRGRPRWSSN